MSIASLIRRSHGGVAWHGPSVVETLEGVDAAKAAARPPAGLHTIWELVLHVTAWQRAALAALDGVAYVSLEGEGDWPPEPGDASDDAWLAALSEMAKVNGELVAATRVFPEERLAEIVPGQERFNFYFLLHGVVQHNVYHAGQIALLKRL